MIIVVILALTLILGTVFGSTFDSLEEIDDVRSRVASMQLDELFTLPTSILDYGVPSYVPLFNSYDDIQCEPSDFEKIKDIIPDKIFLVKFRGQQDVVVKAVVLEPKNFRKIRVEEIILHHLSHPNMLRGICSHIVGGHLMIAMEYKTEVCLRTWVNLFGQYLYDDLNYEEQEGLTYARAEVTLPSIARQLSSALGYLHENRIIHNDVKPENILMDGDHLYLIDFNLAVYAPEGTSEAPHGTILYICPKKHFALPYNNGTDWFAMGVMLYELYTNLHPFASASTQQDVWGLLVDWRIDLDHPDLQNLVQNLCALDSEERWSHANGYLPRIMDHQFMQLL